MAPTSAQRPRRFALPRTDEALRRDARHAADRRRAPPSSLALFAMLGLHGLLGLCSARSSWAAPASAGWTLQCPKGSHIVAYREEADPFEKTNSMTQRRRGLACANAAEQLNGAVFLLRPETSEAVLRMVRAGPWQANAIAWIGQLRDGRPVGTWQQISNDGAKLGVVTLSADGTGAYVERDAERVVRFAGSLVRGRRSGIWRWSDGQGVQRAEASYAEGKLQGESVVRFATGRPEISAHWRDSQRDGLFTSWWPSGVKRWEGPYVREVRDGRWCNWNEHGQLLGCNELQLGDGDWHEWTANGELSSAGALRADRRDGVWRQYFDNGALRNETTYTRGQVVPGSSHNFDAEGKAADRPAISGIGGIGGIIQRGAQATPRRGGSITGGVGGAFGGLRGAGSSRIPGVLGTGGASSAVTVTVRAVGGIPPPAAIPGSLNVVESLVSRCPPSGAAAGSVVHGSWFARVQANGLLSAVSAAPVIGGGTAAPPAWLACAEVRLRAMRFAPHRCGAVEIHAELRVP